MRYDEARRVLGAIYLQISGCGRGYVVGKPARTGRYRTQNGMLSYYTRSSASVGECFDHEGKRYRVVVNEEQVGNPWVAPVYRFVAIPTSA